MARAQKEETSTKIVTSRFSSSNINWKKYLTIEYAFDAIAVLCILAAVIVGLRYVTRKEVWVTAQIRVVPDRWYWNTSFSNPPNWYVYALKKGAEEKTTGGKKIGEITNIEFYDSGYTTKGTIMDVKLLVTYNKNANAYFFKNQVLEVNRPIDISFGQVNTTGIVTQLNGKPEVGESRYITLTGRMYDRYPWFADAIKPGSKLTKGNQALAEVVSVTAVNTRRVVSQGDAFSAGTIFEDPLKRDIDIVVKLLVTKEGDKDLIFRTDQLVKVGNEVSIPLDNNVNLNNVSILSISK